MKRRAFIAMFAEPLTPRNQMAETGNAFIAAWGVWANALNTMKPGTVSLDEAKAWEPMPGLWRKLEKSRRDWLK